LAASKGTCWPVKGCLAVSPRRCPFLAVSTSNRLAIFSFLIVSFGPTRAAGWTITFLTLILTAALLLVALAPYLADLGLLVSFNPTSTPILTQTSTLQPSPTTSAKTALTPTATGISPTRTYTPTINPSPTNTIFPSETPSPQPTTFFITVNSLNGLVIRESADFEAPVVGYANDGDLYEVLNQSNTQKGSNWYQVETDIGEFGWLLGSLVNTQTPIP